MKNCSSNQRLLPPVIWIDAIFIETFQYPVFKTVSPLHIFGVGIPFTNAAGLLIRIGGIAMVPQPIDFCCQ
jgi:hypothetical protein